MKTVQDIVAKCGGREAIAANIQSLSADAVRKWEGFGIPEKHWRQIMLMHKGRLTAKALHELNESYRQQGRAA